MSTHTGSISMIATFPNITGENRAAFQEVAAEAVAAVRAERGNVRYNWFLNPERTTCVVHEEYADSDAVLAHLGNVGTIVGRLAQLGGGLVVDLLGDPSPQLSAALEGRIRSAYAPYNPAG